MYIIACFQNKNKPLQSQNYKQHRHLGHRVG